jgi:hypothetical protein
MMAGSTVGGSGAVSVAAGGGVTGLTAGACESAGAHSAASISEPMVARAAFLIFI